jgi:hypothetical protein
MNEQEIAYMIQVLMTRPLGEAMGLYLKLTNQKLVPATPPPPPTPVP